MNVQQVRAGERPDALDIGVACFVGAVYTHAFEVISAQTPLPSLRFPCILVLLVVAFRTRGREEWPTVRPVEGVGAFVAYGLLLLASALWAVDPDATLLGTGAYVKDVIAVIAVVVLVTRWPTLRLAVWAVVIGAAAMATFSIVQRLTGTSFTFLGFARPPVHELAGGEDIGRVVGPIGNANAYAQMIVVAVPFAVERLVHESRRMLRVLALCSAVVSAVAIALTYSRGGLLALAVVAGACLFRFAPRVAPLIVSAAILAGVLLVHSLPATYTARVESLVGAASGSDDGSDDPSITARGAFFRIGVRMWRDHPSVGVGFENFGDRFPEYNRRVGIDPDEGFTAHSLPLQVLAETGLVGFMLWLLVLVVAVRSLLRARRRAGARGRAEMVGLAGALLIAVLGYHVSAVFQGGSYLMLYWLLLALCLAAGGLEPAEVETSGA